MSAIKHSPFQTRNPIAGRMHTPASVLSAQKQYLKTNISIQTEECTFEPKVNHLPNSKRSLKKFLHDQETYERSRERKLMQLKQEQIDEARAEVTLSPTINPGSRRMASRQGSTSNIFQRLNIRPPQRPQPEYPFSPQILNRSHSIKRNADVTSLLYNDALRRQEKSQFMETERSITDRNSPNPKINSNAGRLAGRKILAELAGIITQEEVSPLVAVLALEDLFHVDLNPARQGETLRKILACISYTNDHHVEVVSSAVLREFVGILVGAEQSFTHFEAADQQAIFQEFRHFYKERLHKEKRSPTPEPLSFHPQTLSSSSKLAQCHRDRACRKIGEFLEENPVNLMLKDGEITIQELFIIDGVRKQQENDKKREEKERKELEECTFKPNIQPLASLNKFKQIQIKPKITLKPNKIKPPVPIPTPKSKQKDKENQTAQKLPPRSDKKPIRNSVGNGESSSRDIQKIIMRMAVGRQKREYSNTITERGYPKDQNWAQLQRAMHRKSVQNLDKMRRLSFKA